MGCGQPCDGFYCYLCTCQQCGVSLINGICLNCTYGDGKPVTCCVCEGPLNGGFCSFYDSRAGNSFAYDSNPNSFDDSQNLSDYPPQPSTRRILDPCFNQNFDKIFPQTSPSFPQQYLCCENSGGPHATFQCQPMNQNFYSSNSSGFDQFQPPQYPVIHHPPQGTSVKMLQARENLMKYIQKFLKKFDCIPFREGPMALLLAHKRFSKINQAFREEQHQPENIRELLRKLLNDLQILNGILLERGEHAAQINTPNWKCPVFYDDDDEYSIQYREYLENSSNAIAPEEPDNSLSMRDDHLSTIPETESDEVIKSSVEDLVPIPTVTFSNLLFNSNDDFTSSDDESLSDEDVSEDNFKIYPNPLFKFDDEYISSDVNPLFDEVLEDIECKDSYDSNLDESTFLVTPLSDSNEDEYLIPCDDVELLLHRDPSTPIMNIVSILEGFIDEPPLKKNDALFDLESKENKWKMILYDAPINDLMTEDKVFDPGIHDQFFSLTYDFPDFEDSRARGFVLRSLELQSLAYGNPIS
uniref:Uncharacterized protein n=1 Tax=Tanacetum cinerariifolium TaxID=118510 RepID=A0A6L2N7Q6_TANCI|nr:hypothetical protein [Tanacetum cinerariifolium]